MRWLNYFLPWLLVVYYSPLRIWNSHYCHHRLLHHLYERMKDFVFSSSSSSSSIIIIQNMFNQFLHHLTVTCTFSSVTSNARISLVFIFTATCVFWDILSFLNPICQTSIDLGWLPWYHSTVSCCYMMMISSSLSAQSSSFLISTLNLLILLHIWPP